MTIYFKKHERKQQPIPPKGIRQGKLKDIEEPKIVDGQFGAREMVKFVWEIRHGGQIYEVRQSVSTSMFPGGKKQKPSKLYQIVEALMGRALVEVPDASVLIGREANLVVSHREFEGLLYASIDSVVTISRESDEMPVEAVPVPETEPVVVGDEDIPF